MALHLCSAAELHTERGTHMAGGWYYASGDERLGPFSGERMKELAASGKILPTDLVWKAGIDTGVLASRITNLFALVPAVAMPAVPKPAEPTADPNAYVPTIRPHVEKKGTATALHGADIVSQDGSQARYRMKCAKCGTKDTSCRTIRIASKTTTANFFCPKCRKKQAVVIQCRGG